MTTRSSDAFVGRDKNGSVTSAWLGKLPPMVLALGILAAFAFGFVVVRIWQIRCDELERRAGFALPPVARIPQPTNAEI
jgi:hypothetical protein